MEDVLPPPVLRALVAAPPQIHFVTFPIRGVLLAVLAGAEERTERFQRLRKRDHDRHLDGSS